MMMMHHMMHEMHEMGGAFRFKRGNGDEVDIRCPANQPLQACVSAASTLMDKVASMGKQGGGTSSGTQGGGSSSQSSGSSSSSQ
jgi:hypothetical protein